MFKVFRVGDVNRFTLSAFSQSKYRPAVVSAEAADLIESAPSGEVSLYDWQRLGDFMKVENRRLLPDTTNAVHISLISLERGMSESENQL